ncbi:MAG: hypothetical protein WD333_06215 [Dehalococcoidia bacterium]
MGIVSAELLRCALEFHIPAGAASDVVGALVLFGTAFFVGMAVRHWLVAPIGGFLGLYGLAWMCNLILDLHPEYYGPPVGLIVLLVSPVGWLAMACGWLGSRTSWVLVRVLGLPRP